MRFHCLCPKWRTLWIVCIRSRVVKSVCCYCRFIWRLLLLCCSACDSRRSPKHTRLRRCFASDPPPISTDNTRILTYLGKIWRTGTSLVTSWTEGTNQKFAARYWIKKPRRERLTVQIAILWYQMLNCVVLCTVLLVAFSHTDWATDSGGRILVPTYTERGCCEVSATDPYGR
jgi:hypothetical protein